MTDRKIMILIIYTDANWWIQTAKVHSPVGNAFGKRALRSVFMGCVKMIIIYLRACCRRTGNRWSVRDGGRKHELKNTRLISPPPPVPVSTLAAVPEGGVTSKWWSPEEKIPARIKVDSDREINDTRIAEADTNWKATLLPSLKSGNPPDTSNPFRTGIFIWEK